MRSHLEDISTYYFLPNENGVNPISLVDCEIIEELIDLLTLIGFPKAIEILELYKERKDEWILDNLRELTQKAKDGEEVLIKDGESLADFFKKIFTKKAIKIKESYYRLDSIVRWEKDDIYIDKSMKYCIILNKNMKSGLYLNEIIQFTNPTKRNEVFDNIKLYLEKESNMKFLND